MAAKKIRKLIHASQSCGDMLACQFGECREDFTPQVAAGYLICSIGNCDRREHKFLSCEATR